MAVRNLRTFPVVIEDNCYIGPNVVIGMGVRIGEGAIIGACSFVNRDVLPYTKVAGCPAKVIGEVMKQNHQEMCGGI